MDICGALTDLPRESKQRAGPQSRDNHLSPGSKTTQAQDFVLGASTCASLCKYTHLYTTAHVSTPRNITPSHKTTLNMQSVKMLQDHQFTVTSVPNSTEIIDSQLE